MSQPQQDKRQTDPSIPHWYHPKSDVMQLDDGEGLTVYDENGDAYLDFVSQLYCVNAGYNNREIIDAITAQLQRIPYVSSAKRNAARTELARRLVDISPENLTDVFFSVTGSEANESAIQLARKYTGKDKVLTRYRSYHGSTYAAGGLTGDPETKGSLGTYATTTGTAKFLPPHEFRSPLYSEDPEVIAERAADHLEYVIVNEGPDTIAAVMMEPVAGSSGGYTAPPGYFQRVREICDKYDILYISDEVIAGFGRVGDWFGIQTEGVDPDILTFAKGVTSSYVPLAGVLTSSEIAGKVREEGHDLGQTFGGHPVACAAGVAAIDAYENGLIDNVRQLEPLFEERLSAIEERYDVVGAVTGRGFLWGVEFADPETGEPFFDSRYESTDEKDNPVMTVVEEAEERGVLVGIGRPAFQVMLSPPLCATEDEVNEALDALEAGIEAAFE